MDWPGKEQSSAAATSLVGPADWLPSQGKVGVPQQTTILLFLAPQPGLLSVLLPSHPPAMGPGEWLRQQQQSLGTSSAVWAGLRPVPN